MVIILLQPMFLNSFEQSWLLCSTKFNTLPINTHLSLGFYRFPSGLGGVAKFWDEVME